MLNLGLESLTVKEESPAVSFEELLQSELDFNDAYQAFIDYKNVCEIVVKAKASSESMAFANSLLNASVESIDISVEALAGKFKEAWNRFVEMWKKFVDWFKGAITKAKPTQLPVEVSPNIAYMSIIERHARTENKQNKTRDKKDKSWANRDFVVFISEAMKTSESLDTIQKVNEWKAYATNFINSLNQIIIYLQNNFKNSDWEYVSDPKIAARYYMSVGPKIIAKLQKTIAKL